MNITDLPKDQLEKVKSQASWGIDIDCDFLGFLDIYEALANIIPTHFTVIDLGCAYNAQSFYFKNHKRVVAVDLPSTKYKTERFCSPNCEIVLCTIEDFIKNKLHEFDLDETFAICSYVPPWYGDNRKMVREAFKNVFVYYPSNKEFNKQIDKRMKALYET